jgi:hypothetical protein
MDIEGHYDRDNSTMMTLKGEIPILNGCKGRNLRQEDLKIHQMNPKHLTNLQKKLRHLHFRNILETFTGSKKHLPPRFRTERADKRVKSPRAF